MFVLIEYNNYYEEIIQELINFKYTPVILFKINLNNRNQIKEDLEKLKQLKNKINPKYSAIQITLDKIENSTIGTINNLKNYFDIIIGLGGLNKVNRFFVESTQIDFLQDPQNTLFLPKTDFIHHFNSGINHILCKMMKEKEIDFICSLNFSYGKKYFISKEIGRINQNLKFARKYKISSIINFVIKYPGQIKTIEELNGLLSFFDISTEQKKESFKILENKINQNKQKQSKNYITKGIKIIK